jgi:hypothetical protein
VLRAIGVWMKIVSKIMMVRAGADIFPTLSFIDTESIASIQWVLTEFFPHGFPFGVIVINIFKTGSRHRKT